MEFKIGDLVTRKSYNHDIIFKIYDIKDNNYYLSGTNIRLVADSNIDDLEIYRGEKDVEEKEFVDRITNIDKLDRNDYFYLPGKILHIDSDKDYLSRCLNFYEQMNIWAVGICEDEDNIPDKIIELLTKYTPNIVVITGHDAYYKNKKYRNSENFIKAVKQARKYEDSHEKLIIIAGACQSNYEELIRAGANFASSPKRVNIHALDPAIVATKISLSEITRDIDLKKILESTKYGKDGMGGIITRGTMYVGYPR